MKKITISLIVAINLLFCFGQVKAQEWFPVGAKWIYSVIYPGDPWAKGETVTFYCKGDTVIDGINAKVNVSSFPKGAYFLKMLSGTGAISVEKIITL